MNYSKKKKISKNYSKNQNKRNKIRLKKKKLIHNKINKTKSKENKIKIKKRHNQLVQKILLQKNSKNKLKNKKKIKNN